MGISEFNDRFSLLFSDIVILQRSCLIVACISDYVEEIEKELEGFHHDEFLNSTVLSHKISAIIAAHKIFDKNAQTQSIHLLLRWIRENRTEFTNEALLKRKINQGCPVNIAEEYCNNAYELTDGDFKELEKRKKDLQKIHDSNVMGLRNRVFAHREDPELSRNQATIQPVEMKTVSDLGFLAHGIYEDISQAFMNGRPLKNAGQEYWNNGKILEHTKRFIDSFRKK